MQTATITSSEKSIKAAIPGHPEPKSGYAAGAAEVYQSCDSRPSRACRPQRLPPAKSLSKLRFPAIQSLNPDTQPEPPKSIKAAIPGHPEHADRNDYLQRKVYQSCDSRPSRA